MFPSVALRWCILWAAARWAGGAPKAVDLVNDVLLAEGGRWVLAAAASTSVPPPYHSCVNLTVTRLPHESDCIMTNLNLTSRRVANVRFVGENEEGDLEISSRGPIHQFMVKRRQKHLLSPESKSEVDWEAAVNQPLCWRPGSRPRKYVKYRYVVAPVVKSHDVLYIVGVKRRMPLPEYEVAILTRTKIDRKRVQRFVDIFNWKNYDNTYGCREGVVTWPPTPPTARPWPSFWMFFEHCLPRLHIKCALGYDLRDSSDKVNHVTPHEQFAGIKPSFGSAETESLFVTHNK